MFSRSSKWLRRHSFFLAASLGVALLASCGGPSFGIGPARLGAPGALGVGVSNVENGQPVTIGLIRVENGHGSEATVIDVEPLRVYGDLELLGVMGRRVGGDTGNNLFSSAREWPYSDDTVPLQEAVAPAHSTDDSETLQLLLGFVRHSGEIAGFDGVKITYEVGGARYFAYSHDWADFCAASWPDKECDRPGFAE